MAYTRISAAKSAKAALAYASGNGHGHNKNSHRNVMISTCGGVIPGIEWYKQFERNHAKAKYQTPMQVHRIIVSYSLSEFDPNSDEDIVKADDLAKQFVEQVYPNHLAVIFTQNDGIGGKLHSHIILSNVDTLNHTALSHDRTFDKIKDKFNRVAREAVDENGIPLIRLDVSILYHAGKGRSRESVGSVQGE